MRSLRFRLLPFIFLLPAFLIPKTLYGQVGKTARIESIFKKMTDHMNTTLDNLIHEQQQLQKKERSLAIQNKSSSSGLLIMRIFRSRKLTWQKSIFEREVKSHLRKKNHARESALSFHLAFKKLMEQYRQQKKMISQQDHSDPIKIQKAMILLSQKLTSAERKRERIVRMLKMVGIFRNR